MANNPGLTEEHEACTSSGLFSPWTRRKRLDQTTFSLDSKDKSQGTPHCLTAAAVSSEESEKTQGVTCSHYLRSTLNPLPLNSQQYTHSYYVSPREKACDWGRRAKKDKEASRTCRGELDWDEKETRRLQLAYRQFGFGREGSKCDLSRSYKAGPSLFPQDGKTRLLLKKLKRTKGRWRTAGVSTWETAR